MKRGHWLVRFFLVLGVVLVLFGAFQHSIGQTSLATKTSILVGVGMVLSGIIALLLD